MKPAELDTYPVAYIDGLLARVAELEEANRSNRVVMGGLAAAVDAWKDHCKRLEDAARAVYIDSIVSDHPWTELEARNMHALRDVLEAKP